VLEVLNECEHPVGLITKSSLIERDIDILGARAARRQACASITLTTLDPEISRTLEAAHDAGAVGAHYVVLRRLPWEVNPLFQEWLQAHFPDRAQRVMNRVREMRGGKDYDSDFTRRMHGEGVWADLIRQRFTKTAERLGLTRNSMRFEQMDFSRFRRPLIVPAGGAKQTGNATGQLDLF
jgi:DNA repair photolyase